MSELEVLLQMETDFSKYIDLLAKAAKKYCVFIVSHDTPCGAPDFTAELASKFCYALGTTVLLHDKYHCAYIAVINEGKLLYEDISNIPIEFNCVINRFSIYLKSDVFRDSVDMISRIKIDGIVRIWGHRGLNIIVFDEKKDIFIDRVGFDTYDQTGVKISTRRVDLIKKEEWDEYYSHNPDLILLNVTLPLFPTENLSINEKYIIDTALERDVILKNIDKSISAISEYIHSAEGLMEVLSPPRSYIGTDGVRRFFDRQGEYVTIENGHRVTIGLPEHPKRSIWFIGGCTVFGVGSRDENTIPSALQTMLNKYAQEHSFAVNNYGYYLWRASDIAKEIMAILNSLPAKPGDIVCVHNQRYAPVTVDIDCKTLGKRPHDFGELFWDVSHYTENGNRLIAKSIFDTLAKHNFFADTTYDLMDAELPPIHKNFCDLSKNYGFSPEQLQQLDEYKKSLSSFYQCRFGNVDIQPQIGAIVMNCNPFTLGHRYLIEQAASKVDLLVIFVVQEDKSFFPFEDRIILVDKGTEDLPNVAVTASGNFIISSLTFIEYFNKEEIQDRIIDSSNDVTLFAREIAPAMRISVRFVGDEPFDRITKQYNHMLSVILPKYGIKFEELPRVEKDGEAISASRVRKLLEQKDWNAIERLVPKTTFDYLCDRFK